MIIQYIRRVWLQWYTYHFMDVVCFRCNLSEICHYTPNKSFPLVPNEKVAKTIEGFVRYQPIVYAMYKPLCIFLFSFICIIYQESACNRNNDGSTSWDTWLSINCCNTMLYLLEREWLCIIWIRLDYSNILSHTRNYYVCYIAFQMVYLGSCVYLQLAFQQRYLYQ
jgi:hypothetical protein